MSIRKILYPVIFISFFLGGIALAFAPTPSAASSLDVSYSSISAPAVMEAKAVSELESNASSLSQQLNILMVGVDEVGITQTRLRSLWLVMVPPGGGPVTFMPIYPQPAGMGEDYSQPHNPIIVDARFPESATIVRILADQGTWWDEVILFDETGMLSVLDILGGAKEYAPQLVKILASQGGAMAWDDPQSALQHQTNMLKQLCSMSSSFHSSISPEIFGIPDDSHLKISSNKIDLMSELFVINASIISFGCQFPTVN